MDNGTFLSGVIFFVSEKFIFIVELKTLADLFLALGIFLPIRDCFFKLQKSSALRRITCGKRLTCGALWDKIKNNDSEYGKEGHWRWQECLPEEKLF